MTDNDSAPQTELESRTDSLAEGHELSGYATIDIGLNAITTQLKRIVYGGTAVVIALLIVGFLYVQNLNDKRREGFDAACTAIERLAVANERFIRDVSGPGAVTDERLSIYHLYIDPAIDTCRESAAADAGAPRYDALRP